MAQSLAKNIKRYKDLAWLLIRYGRSDLAGGLGVEAESPGPDGPKDAEEGRDLAKDLEKLGPTYVKVGQLLSTRADLLPPAYLTALSRLQDSVEPFSFAEVERIVQAELGLRLSKGFLEFESTPIAAASLGQVHRARLRDGRTVAVKVQRPGIRETILEDLEAFSDLARFLDKHAEFAGRYEFEKMVDEFRHVLLAELDYRKEARNLRLLAENLKTFERIVVPEPIDDYTSERVLTMDYVRGSKVTSLSPLASIDLDGEGLAEELFQAYLQQILVDGFFHADPHPGNVFVTDDGRIALIDLGMTARFSGTMQEDLLKLLLAVAEGHGDQAADRATRLGRQREGFDSAEFRRRVGAVVESSRDASMEQLQIGRVLLDLTRAAGDTGLQLPSELTLLGKTLLNLDQVGRVLAPGFDPNASVRRNTAVLLRKRLFKSTTPGSLASAALDTKEFLEKLPSRANRLLELIIGNKLRLRVDTIDEEMLIQGLHKIANRIALGLVLASLIVGAALLTQVPTSFRIFGYPGLAMILFLTAAAGGIALAVSIVVSDRKKPRSRPGSAGS